MNSPLPVAGTSSGVAVAARADPSGCWGGPHSPALHPQLPATQHGLAHGSSGESPFVIVQSHASSMSADCLGQACKVLWVPHGSHMLE